jgi:hypothetical protein
VHDTESNALRSRRRQRAEADIRVLLETWRDLRASGEDLPLWSRFDPVLCFPYLVGSLFVLALEPSGWRVRLVGSALRGMIVGATGKMLHEIYPPYLMQVFAPRLDQIVAAREPMQIRQAAMYDRVLHSLSLVLPFHQGEFLVTRLVAATFYLDEFVPAGALFALSSEIESTEHDLVE